MTYETVLHVLSELQINEQVLHALHVSIALTNEPVLHWQISQYCRLIASLLEAEFNDPSMLASNNDNTQHLPVLNENYIEN